MTPIEPETVEAARAEMHAWGMALERREARELYFRDQAAFEAAVRAEAYRSGWNEALRASGGSVLLELAEPAEGEVTE